MGKRFEMEVFRETGYLKGIQDLNQEGKPAVEREYRGKPVLGREF